MPFSNDQLKLNFEQQGFVVLKQAFTKDEIEDFRELAYKQLEIDKQKDNVYSIPKSQAFYVKGDLLSKELLGKIVLDNRVLNLVRTVLGSNEITYFGDGSYQIGVGLRGYHRDNIDREYNNGPDWDGEYDIVRVGLYLQDHKKYSGGLKVKLGTHHNKTGTSTILEIEEGDLVIWNLRTEHSGNAVRLKLLSDLPIDYFERFVPSFLKKDEHRERIACFFSYAKNGKHLQRYFEKYLQVNTNILEGLKRSRLNTVTLEDAKAKGLEILKPIPEYGM